MYREMKRNCNGEGWRLGQVEINGKTGLPSAQSTNSAGRPSQSQFVSNPTISSLLLPVLISFRLFRVLAVYFSDSIESQRKNRQAVYTILYNKQGSFTCVRYNSNMHNQSDGFM